MKKLVTFGVALALCASVLPGAALAQTATTTSSNLAQVESLLKQLKSLQDQLATLNKQRGETVTEIKDSMILLRELRQGMSGDDVKALQEMLAADPDIYPEGIISGFYGPLTAQAVRRFQMRSGLEGVGSVGPMTRARLNALAGNHDFACRAWGHLIAPGQMKRMVGAAAIDVSNCPRVPGGIGAKLNGDWRNGSSTTASTTDTTAPEISHIEANDITNDSAEVSWTTNERTKAVLWFGTDEDLDGADSMSFGSFTKDRSAMLDDLDADTDYYFRIVVSDKAGNTASSSIEHFTTEE